MLSLLLFVQNLKWFEKPQAAILDSQVGKFHYTSSICLSRFVVEISRISSPNLASNPRPSTPLEIRRIIYVWKPSRGFQRARSRWLLLKNLRDCLFPSISCQIPNCSPKVVYNDSMTKKTLKRHREDLSDSGKHIQFGQMLGFITH